MLSLYNADNGCVEPNLYVIICCVAGAAFSLALLFVTISLLPFLCSYWSFSLVGTMHSATIPFNLFFGVGGVGGVVGFYNHECALGLLLVLPALQCLCVWFIKFWQHHVSILLSLL